jgi:hypothetical protein
VNNCQKKTKPDTSHYFGLYGMAFSQGPYGKKQMKTLNQSCSSFEEKLKQWPTTKQTLRKSYLILK